MTEKDRHLEQRHAEEIKFHDTKYSEGPNKPALYGYNPTAVVLNKMLEDLGDIRGRKVLEYGCGDGWVTARLASGGAEVFAFDISKEAIAKTERFVSKQGLEKNCHLQTMSAEKLEYEDNTFDVVFGFAILHHLDLDQAMPELHRVIKPGGVAIFAEPLGSNPLINMYRRRTPEFRTPDERPMLLKEFSTYTKSFSKFSHDEFYLTAIVPVALANMGLNRKLYDLMLAPCLAADRLILGLIPALGRWAWYSILKLER